MSAMRDAGSNWVKTPNDLWQDERYWSLTLAARALLYSCWAYCSNKMKDGRILVPMLRLLEPEATESDHKSLVDHGFIRVVGGHAEVVGFLELNQHLETTS